MLHVRDEVAIDSFGRAPLVVEFINFQVVCIPSGEFAIAERVDVQLRFCEAFDLCARARLEIDDGDLV